MDSAKGTNDTYCGSSRPSACGSLTKALERVKDNGKVHMTGDQVLDEPILLNKNVDIYGPKGYEPTITRENVAIVFAFILQKEIRLCLKHLRFTNIGILNMTMDSVVILKYINSIVVGL